MHRPFWLAAIVVSLLLPQIASASEPTPFASASASCPGDVFGAIVFPSQSASHSNVIFHFQSLESTGYINRNQAYEYNPAAEFAANDNGWGAIEEEVKAGTTPTIKSVCREQTGSIEVSLAERPSTPATFSGVTSADEWSALPFLARGSGQYDISLTIEQGAVKISEVSGILESSGEYSLGSLSKGNHEPRIDAEAGPTAIWSVTIRELPVVINKLTFGQSCIAPGTGIPATFSTTGETKIAAMIVNSSGAVVRDLGAFSVGEGESSIPWDGRGEGGSTLPDGSYALKLVSADPQGESTTDEAPIYVTSSGPSVSMTSPATITPSQSVAFQIADASCGVASALVAINGERVGTYGTEESSLPSNGALVFVPRRTWKVGANHWEIKATDDIGNVVTKKGTFTVAASSKKQSGSSAHPANRAELRSLHAAIFPPANAPNGAYFKCGRIAWAEVSSNSYALVAVVAKQHPATCQDTFEGATELLVHRAGRWQVSADLIHETCSGVPEAVLRSLRPALVRHGWRLSGYRDGRSNQRCISRFAYA